MKDNEFTRRKFIKRTIGTGFLMAGSGLLPAYTFFKEDINANFDAKGLPTSVLGKTGVKIPRMAIGLGSRFCDIPFDSRPDRDYRGNGQS